MRIASQKMVLMVTLASLIFSAYPLSFAQTISPQAGLFRKLISAKTSDQAAEQLLRLGKTDTVIRDYVASHLPSLVEAGPQSSFLVWNNAVKLAGGLKIAEVAPALAKWISVRSGSPTTTLSEEARLTHYPAALALVRIHDPAVPALELTLERGSLRERWQAAYALTLIGSSKAKSVLRMHAAHEPDESLRDFITRANSK